jgi:bis(5'-nucleosidyl)-tetraphosphatase
MITEYASGAVVYQMREGKIWYLLLQSATSDFWACQRVTLKKTRTSFKRRFEKFGKKPT